MNSIHGFDSKIIEKNIFHRVVDKKKLRNERKQRIKPKQMIDDSFRLSLSEIVKLRMCLRVITFFINNNCHNGS